jgi:transglutaminase-like putative cysteine protease
VADAARDLMARIHEDFTYEPQATDVNTPALEALALRKGVCQDLAHVMLGCLRSLGVPARYVSGYLLTEPPPGKPRLLGSDASHAWVSVYLPAEDGGPGGAWTDLDPTNNRAPGEDYVTLAVGRDYYDVSPVRGVIHGGANHTLHVAVTVTPVAEPAPTIAATE